MLSDPAALEAVADGQDGLVAGLSPGKIWLDFSTVTPAASRRAAERAREKGADFCDVPVAGSVKPANDGTLKLLAGGDEAVLARAKRGPRRREHGDPPLRRRGTGLGDEAREQPDVRRGTRDLRRSPPPRREAGLAGRARHWRGSSRLRPPRRTSSERWRSSKAAEGRRSSASPSWKRTCVSLSRRPGATCRSSPAPTRTSAAATAAGFGAEDFSWVIPHLAGKRPGSK